MSIRAEVHPTELVVEQATQVLIWEARRRQRRRRLIFSGVLFILAVMGWFAARTTGTDGPVHSARPTNRPVLSHPIVAAGQFSGWWHFHTVVVSIQPNGEGSVSWPGPLGPGQSEATAKPARADIRVTSVNGAHATALMTGSTEPSAVPDGPVQLRVTGQDLLFVGPLAHRGDSPFGSFSFGLEGLCGPKAAALTVTQQVAAGINCGA
jgi:hypothetical protein